MPPATRQWGILVNINTTSVSPQIAGLGQLSIDHLKLGGRAEGGLHICGKAACFPLPHGLEEQRGGGPGHCYPSPVQAPPIRWLCSSSRIPNPKPELV